MKSRPNSYTIHSLEDKEFVIYMGRNPDGRSEYTIYYRKDVNSCIDYFPALVTYKVSRIYEDFLLVIYADIAVKYHPYFISYIKKIHD